MARLRLGLAVAALVAALGCVAPPLRPAHSLDQLEMSGGLSVLSKQTELSGDVRTAQGERVPAGRHFEVGDTPDDVHLELRMGLGAGFEVGTRGQLPLIQSTDLKWTLLDERTSRSPLSLAFDVELGLGVSSVPGIRGAVLMSTTRPLGSRVALRLTANAWLGRGGMSYRVELPRHAGAGVDPPTLELVYEATSITVPLGVEVPIRVFDRVALTPWAAWAPWIPLDDPELIDADCHECTVGVSGAEPGFGAYVMFGFRVEPWPGPEGREAP